jgi:hypothetical protein
LRFSAIAHRSAAKSCITRFNFIFNIKEHMMMHTNFAPWVITTVTSGRTGMAIAAAVLTSLTIASGNAQAVNLTAGGSVGTGGTTAAARPELAGLVLEDVLRNVVLDSGATVQVQDRVVRSDVTGTLDFYYRIINNNQFGVRLGDLVSHSSFANFSTDVDYRIDGVGNPNPLSAARSIDGSTVTFDFDDDDNSFLSLNAGESTRFFFVKTQATLYNALGQGSLRGTNGSTLAFTSFQPTSIPTPALLPGIIGMGFGILRRRKQSLAR